MGVDMGAVYWSAAGKHERRSTPFGRKDGEQIREAAVAARALERLRPQLRHLGR